MLSSSIWTRAGERQRGSIDPSRSDSPRACRERPLTAPDPPVRGNEVDQPIIGPGARVGGCVSRPRVQERSRTKCRSTTRPARRPSRHRQDTRTARNWPMPWAIIAISPDKFYLHFLRFLGATEFTAENYLSSSSFVSTSVRPSPHGAEWTSFVRMRRGGIPRDGARPR